MILMILEFMPQQISVVESTIIVMTTCHQELVNTACATIPFSQST
jgi:hypothetical protein